MSSVYFGGSRSLSPSPLVGQVVRSVLSAGQSVRVGCAAGADALVVLSALQVSPSALSVFAVGGAGGQGFPSSSGLAAVLQAQAAGAAVSWWAGGGPAVPMRGRLIQRSKAGFAGASAAVFFLASPASSGSLAVAAQAVKAGVPVFVFAVGFTQPPAALAGQAGQWVAASFAGSPCWQWWPAAAQLSLF